jgi:hypothetical protein
VSLLVYCSPGANVISTVDEIKRQLPSIRASIPSNEQLLVTGDLTTTIRASVKDVEGTLVLSIGLVVFVVFLFLRNARATQIPGAAVTISVIGTFAVMYLCGYTLDNLSLMALAISTGFVVDDAIVVMENVVRLMELGVPSMEAALKGSEETGPTVLSMPDIPVGVPSELLERRPDIAAPERTMAEANALIGVQKAAYHPTLSITGTAGFKASKFSKWMTSPSRYWSVGPTATETIFDGGLRRSTMAQYTALYNADVARYKTDRFGCVPTDRG